MEMRELKALKTCLMIALTVLLSFSASANEGTNPPITIYCDICTTGPAARGAAYEDGHLSETQPYIVWNRNINQGWDVTMRNGVIESRVRYDLPTHTGGSGGSGGSGPGSSWDHIDDGWDIDPFCFHYDQSQC